MSTPGAPRTVRFGVFEFAVETGDLWKAGHRIRLPEQPRQVLLMLVARPGELVTREEVRAALWPDDTFVDFDAGLNVVVNKISPRLRPAHDRVIHRIATVLESVNSPLFHFTSRSSRLAIFQRPCQPCLTMDYVTEKPDISIASVCSPPLSQTGRNTTPSISSSANP